MLHPYQQLAQLQSATGQKFLLAALGSKLVVSSEEGKALLQWTSITQDGSSANQTNGDDRPAKKQKLTSNDSVSPGFITKLTTAPGCEAAVVVTEDKSLIVLDVDENGTLSESSRRLMPKRPSAIQIIAASKTILCADKFGDVYSLPLFPTLEDDQKFAQTTADVQDAESTQFKPSATTLTVHSKRNRMALESQQKQKKFTPRKAPLAFVHQLLLGHVSMLTDMIYAHPNTAAHTQRIITADRDEHIRVSRCLPQAHIIEGYCLGHEEFVSKVCSIKDTTLLVSGGGDDWLGLWDWTTFQLKYKIFLRQALQDAELSKPEEKVSVSQLWELSDGKQKKTATVVGVCERIAALILVVIDIAGDAEPNVNILPTQGFPLSMVPWSNGYVFSFDPQEAGGSRLQHYKLQLEGDKATLLPSTEPAVGQLEAIAEEEADRAFIDGLLYTTTTLRKRRGWDEPEDE